MPLQQNTNTACVTGINIYFLNGKANKQTNKQNEEDHFCKLYVLMVATKGHDNKCFTYWLLKALKYLLTLHNIINKET